MPKRKVPEKQQVETIEDDFAAFESESETNSETDQELSPEKRAELLKGFDSDSSNEEQDDDRIIELSNLTPNITASLARQKPSDEPGVLYIGHIPHGFYEPEMTSYFTQFGEIDHLRISRSKKTGRSKGFGFIQFHDKNVAEIVAQTMHNYLLAGKLLQVKIMTPDEVAAKKDLWKGANRRFVTVPWTQLAKQRNDAPKTETQWREVEERERKRRQASKEAIKAAGIDYTY